MEDKKTKAAANNDVRHRQFFTGVVVSDKMAKTRVVSIKRTLRHSLYQKNLIRQSRLLVHDEKNESKTGDLVMIGSHRPMSRNKHFSLVKIVEKRVVQ